MNEVDESKVPIKCKKTIEIIRGVFIFEFHILNFVKSIIILFYYSNKFQMRSTKKEIANH